MLIFIPVVGGAALAVSLLRPYKQDWHAVVDSLMLAAIAFNDFVILAGIILLELDNCPLYVLYIVSLLAPLLFMGGCVYFGIKRKYFMKKETEDTLLQNISNRPALRYTRTLPINP